MTMEGNDPDVNYQTLKYHRGRNKNAGNMYFRNTTRVASFACEFHLTTVNPNAYIISLISPTNIADQYFIGQWALAQMRMDYYGK
ncbi:hypothetical protein KEM48_011596 [Puccinia striiformis f. sp. tritici PST-130]|nr:hypothetical protein KEM48_011596 [Puccinia striiformis f. sp. tritici PST-130]